jgi:hypothetical protein
MNNKKEKTEHIPYNILPYRLIVEILSEFYWFDYVGELIRYMTTNKNICFCMKVSILQRFFNERILYGYFAHDRQRKFFHLYKSVDMTTTSFRSTTNEKIYNQMRMFFEYFNSIPTVIHQSWVFEWDYSKNYKLLRSLKNTKMSNLLICSPLYEFIPNNLNRLHTKQTEQRWSQPTIYANYIAFFSNVTFFGHGLTNFHLITCIKKDLFLKKACEECLLAMRKATCTCWSKEINECMRCRMYIHGISCDKCETSKWNLVFDTCVFTDLSSHIYNSSELWPVCEKIYSEWVSQLSELLKREELKYWELKKVEKMVSKNPSMVPQSLRYKDHGFLLPKFAIKVGNFNIRFRNLIFK